MEPSQKHFLKRHLSVDEIDAGTYSDFVRRLNKKQQEESDERNYNNAPGDKTA